jgi:hypothetical protein
LSILILFIALLQTICEPALRIHRRTSHDNKITNEAAPAN